MKTNHTPTPWAAELTNDPAAPVRFTITGADGGSIAACASSVKRPPAEKLANARLIVAAPELLAAVHQLYDWIENNVAYGLPTKEAKHIDALLAKIQEGAK